MVKRHFIFIGQGRFFRKVNEVRVPLPSLRSSLAFLSTYPRGHRKCAWGREGAKTSSQRLRACCRWRWRRPWKRGEVEKEKRKRRAQREREREKWKRRADFFFPSHSCQGSKPPKNERRRDASPLSPLSFFFK